MFKALKRANDNWKIFPNIGNIAYYSFFTQSVHLSSVEKYDIEKLIDLFLNQREAIDNSQYKLMRKILAVLHHEYTHWIDNISTV